MNQPTDHRTDIYSLGCTFYQLLTARPPYPRKDQAAVIGAHLMEPPPSPRAIRPELPAALDAVIATATAKQPGDRFASCGAFADAALAACDTAAPIAPSPKPAVPERTSRTAETVNAPARTLESMPTANATAALEAASPSRVAGPASPPPRTEPPAPIRIRGDDTLVRVGDPGGPAVPARLGPPASRGAITWLRGYWRRYPVRVILGVLTIVAVALAIGAVFGVVIPSLNGSSDRVIDRSDLERAVGSKFSDVKSVNCPDPLKLKIGASTRCVITKQDNSRRDVTAAVGNIEGTSADITVSLSPY